MLLAHVASHFLVFLLFAVSCQPRQDRYSRLLNQLTNVYASYYSTELYGDIPNLVHCVRLCYEDDYCAEFLYSGTRWQCIVLRFHTNRSRSYQYSVPVSDQMLHFRREFNWIEYSGHLYFHGGKDVKLKWMEAKIVCQKMGAHLVEIESKQESDWLKAEFFIEGDRYDQQFIYRCSAWIGLNDIDTEGQYVWDHSNTSVVFTNWYPGEPSVNSPTKAATRDCIDVLRDGEWNDRLCSFLTSFICEKTI